MVVGAGARGSGDGRRLPRARRARRCPVARLRAAPALPAPAADQGVPARRERPRRALDPRSGVVLGARCAARARHLRGGSRPRSRRGRGRARPAPRLRCLRARHRLPSARSRLGRARRRRRPHAPRARALGAPAGKCWGGHPGPRRRIGLHRLRGRHLALAARRRGADDHARALAPGRSARLRGRVADPCLARGGGRPLRGCRRRSKRSKTVKGAARSGRRSSNCDRTSC